VTLCWGADRPLLRLEGDAQGIANLRQLFSNHGFEVRDDKSSRNGIIILYPSLKHKYHFNHEERFYIGYTVAAMLAEFSELITHNKFKMADDFLAGLELYKLSYLYSPDRANIIEEESKPYYYLHVEALQQIVKTYTPNADMPNEPDKKYEKLDAYFKDLAKRTFPQKKNLDDIYAATVNEIWNKFIDLLQKINIKSPEELFSFFNSHGLENVIKDNLYKQQTKSEDDYSLPAIKQIAEGWDNVCQKTKKLIDVMLGTKFARENIEYEIVKTYLKNRH
jgi:hypothetical protein